MDKFMKRAVELSAENVREGGQPFGAVLVKDNEIIAEGVNEVHIKYDVSGHAELVAIRIAQEKLQTNDISGDIMNASGEPCPMCLTAMFYVGIEKEYDVSGHAELVAISIAQEKRQTDDLSGAIMYASGEPCPMCLTAMFYVGIEKGYYCASIEETADVGLGASVTLYEDFQKPREERTVQMYSMLLEEGQEDTMKLWKEQN